MSQQASALSPLMPRLKYVFQAPSGDFKGAIKVTAALILIAEAQADQLDQSRGPDDAKVDRFRKQTKWAGPNRREDYRAAHLDMLQ